MDNTIPTILETLIKIPSISGYPKPCKEIIQYVEDLFAATSYRVHMYEDAGVYSLTITKKQDLHFDVLFLGHLDVVHGEAEQFQPFVAKGAMHGRGAADMKGGCAAMITLFLENENNPLFDNLGLVFTTDEEIGGFHGTEYLIANHNLRAKVAYTPDGPNGSAFEPCIKEKGIVGFYLKTTGRAAHSSTAWKGENAIDKLLLDIATIKKLYSYATNKNTWTISCSINQITGGDTINKVPDYAEAFIDMRYTPDFTKEAIIENIRKAIKYSEIDLFVTANPVDTAEDNTVVQKLIQATEHLIQKPIKAISSNGASDMRWFVPQHTTTIVMASPASLFHIQDEWVDLQGLETLKDILANFVTRYYAS